METDPRLPVDAGGAPIVPSSALCPIQGSSSTCAPIADWARSVRAVKLEARRTGAARLDVGVGEKSRRRRRQREKDRRSRSDRRGGERARGRSRADSAALLRATWLLDTKASSRVRRVPSQDNMLLLKLADPLQQSHVAQLCTLEASTGPIAPRAVEPLANEELQHMDPRVSKSRPLSRPQSRPLNANV